MFTQVDKHGVVVEGVEGLFQSENTMVRYTEHSMIVSKIPTASEVNMWDESVAAIRKC